MSDKYRADIDGLRAVSVIGVILFHAGMGSGGYIGVDVFFVISGYLITGLILKDLSLDRFSLAEFWMRRIRRIAPASVVMLACVLLVGYWLMLPADLVTLGDSALAQICLLSNVYFWRDTGYFAAGAELKPLLHTWSLAVEEQFYVVLPLVLWFLHRNCKKYMFKILMVATIASCLLSAYGMSHFPSATFFLLPTRAWELLAGSLLAHQKSRIPTGSMAEVVSLAGAIAVVAPMCYYNEQTVFPGVAAIPPVIGAVLLILSNTERLTRIGQLLAWWPLVFVGRASYSLYLWHWPILAFGRYVNDGPLTAPKTFCLLILTFVISVLSLRYVERTVRQQVCFSTRFSLLRGFACASIALAIFSFAFRADEGCRFRAPSLLGEPTTRTLGGDMASLRHNRLPKLGATQSNSPSFIVWGDSHAGVTLPVFDELGADADVMGISASLGGNPPLPGVDISWNADLREWNEGVLKLVELHAIKHVFLVARWASFVEGATPYDVSQGGFVDEPLIYNRDAALRSTETALDLFENRLTELCKRLIGKGSRVYILTQVPEQHFNPMRRALISMRTAGLLAHPSRGVTRDEHDMRQSRVSCCLDQLKELSPLLQVINFDDAIFDSDGVSQLQIDGKLVYSDSHHLTPFGVEKIWRMQLESVFQEISSHNLTAAWTDE